MFRLLLFQIMFYQIIVIQYVSSYVFELLLWDHSLK